MGRTTAAAVLGVAVGFGLGLAVRGCDPESAPTGDAPRPAVVDPPPPSTRPPAEGSARAERPRAEPPPQQRHTIVPASSGRDVAGDVREVPLEDAPTGWTDVQVELVTADGEAIPGTRVRASPVADRSEGLDWLATPGGGATFDANDEGRGVMRLSYPVRYDFGAHRGLWILWKLEVGVPPAGVASPIRMVDGLLAEIEIAAEPPPEPGEVLTLQLAAAPGTTARLDGGERLGPGDSTDWFELTFEAPVWRRRVPAALRWRVQGRGDTRIETTETHAGARVVVRRSHDVLLVKGSLDMDTAERLGHRSVLVALDVDWAKGPVPHLAVGTHLNEHTGSAVAVRVASGSGAVRWSGPEIEPGQTTYDLQASRTVEVPVRVRRPRGGSDPVVRCEVADGAGALPATLECTVRRCADPYRSREFDVEPGSDRAIPDGDACWAWILPCEGRETWIAGPVRLAAGGTHALRFAPGGFVIVTIRGKVPESVGEVSIGRADGAPLVPDDFADVRARIEPVQVLGPFAPGEVVLDVYAGDVRWGRYAVTIRAGEHKLLDVGPFGGTR